MKLEEKVKAINLRKNGYSYNKILKLLDVSKSTLSLWLRDLELEAEEEMKLLKGRELARYKGARAQYNKRIRKTNQIIKEGQNEVKLLMKDTLFIAGLMLYWAEGSDDFREKIKFSNSDPAMIRFMIWWFRKYSDVSKKRFRIGLHIHTLHCRKNVENFWSKTTKIPLNQFQKTFIKPTTLKQKRNPLYNGTCNIVISHKDLFRRIKGWKLGFIKELRLSKKNDDLSL